MSYQIQPIGLELLVLQHDVLAGLALIAFYLVFVVDRLAGLGIDIAGVNTVAGGAVERMEAHLIRLRGGRQQRYRAGDQRQL